MWGLGNQQGDNLVGILVKVELNDAIMECTKKK